MDVHDSLCRKVEAVFGEIAGDRVQNLRGEVIAHAARASMERALQKETDLTPEQASGLAFNLLDWNSDAAFLVALLLYPERFTDEEIAAGVTTFMVHVPDHVAEAARIGGFGSDGADEGADAI